MDKKDFGFFIKYWIFCIAVIIVCINIFCRVKDAIASREYEKSDGTVASVRTGTATFKEGGYRGHSYTYRNGDVHYATIEYKTADGAYECKFRSIGAHFPK